MFMNNSFSYFIPHFVTIGKYVVIVTELTTKFVETAFENLWRSVAFIRSVKTEVYSSAGQKPWGVLQTLRIALLSLCSS